MSVVQKRKLKLKKPLVVFNKILLFICLLCLLLFGFYRYEISKLKAIGYSEISSKKILHDFKQKYIMDLGENKTLNAAFESPDYKEENLDSYSKIKYHEHKNLISNINALLEKGYSNNNINMILDHGNDEDVTSFASRDKIKYLEEFYNISYAKLRYYDEYVLYSNETGEDEETTVLMVNLGLNKGDYTEPFEVDTFSKEMLVNRHFKIKDELEPTTIINIDENYTNGEEQKGDREAVAALKKMFDDASSQGFNLVVNSSYRSFAMQEELCSEYRVIYGDNYVNNYLALPGYSEHQTGLSFDIGSRNTNVFANSKEYGWMVDNAYKYGFILRYTKVGAEITQFRSEPWHYRFVGKKIAEYIYENDITFEEYYAMFLDND